MSELTNTTFYFTYKSLNRAGNRILQYQKSEGEVFDCKRLTDGKCSSWQNLPLPFNFIIDIEDNKRKPLNFMKFFKCPGTAKFDCTNDDAEEKWLLSRAVIVEICPICSNSKLQEKESTTHQTQKISCKK